MPKNLFQDMVKVKNSSSKIPKVDFPKYSNMKEIRKVEEPQKAPEIKKISKPKFTEPPTPRYTEFEENGIKKSRHGLWLVAVISIIFFIFALSFLFANATVIVIPKVEDITLNENLHAIKDSNSEGLSFDLVIISGEESKRVIGSERREVALTSKGTAFIYNAFGPAPQKLSINTKLEGSNGKIYKTATEIIVPGVDAEGMPGKVEVQIIASEAGEEYDSAPLDFKIFGFKGTSKYDKFYGRSVGDITGGFKGTSPVISDVDKESALVELRATLKEKLLQKATDQIPSGFILFKDAAFLNIDREGVEFSSDSTDNTLPVKTSGTLYGFLLSEEELTAKIAKDNIAQYNDEPIYILNIKDLQFSISNSEMSFINTQSINFNLSGTAKVVWRFDDVNFKGALLGKSKKDFNEILSQYPNFSSAELSISPLWVRSIPDKSKDIKIIVDYPKQ